MGRYEYNSSEVIKICEEIFKFSPQHLESKENQRQYLVYVHAVALAAEMAFDLLKSNSVSQENYEQAMENIMSSVNTMMAQMNGKLTR